MATKKKPSKATGMHKMPTTGMMMPDAAMGAMMGSAPMPPKRMMTAPKKAPKKRGK